MLVTQNRYWAAPGNEAAVLETRRAASRVLQRLGLPSGRILVPRPGAAREPEDLPTVVWMLALSDSEEGERYNAVLLSDPEFTAILQRMGALCRRFERERYAFDDGVEENSGAFP